MKLLFLIRHAKSDWNSPDQRDFDRPLNPRGKKDAPAIAKRLQKHELVPELIFSSDAERAKETALAMAKVWDYPADNIIWKPELYYAGLSTFLDVLAGISDKTDSAAIFSHNPGITSFANMLVPGEVDKMPTCGVAIIKADTKSWSKFMQSKRELFLFEYPKRED